VVVSAINRNLPCLSSYGQIIEDTRLCLPGVQPFEVRRIKREANQAAHLLAEYGLRSLVNHVW
jgi:hypothetical protein